MKWPAEISGPPLDEGRGLLTGGTLFYLVLALVLAHVLLSATSSLQKSAAFDEGIHLAAGYSYWTRNDFRLQPENGNLPQRLASLPLLLLKPGFPDTADPAWQGANKWQLAYNMMYLMGNDSRAMLFWGRMMILLLSVALALVVFFWSKSLFGPAGGLVSLALYAFSPAMLAHSRFATSDMAAALFFLAATGMAWRMFRRVDAWSLLLTGLLAGLLLVSKMSGLLLLPVAGILLAFRVASREPLTVVLFRRWIIGRRVRKGLVLFALCAVQAAVAWGVVWGFYGFRYSAFPEASDPPGRFETSLESELETMAGPLGFGIEFLRDRKLIPEAYLYGLAYVSTHSQVRRAFMNGRYSIEGWWTFFPFAFLVKTPLLVFLLLLAGAGGLVLLWPWANLSRLAPLAALFAVYWAVSIPSHLNIGHRHILPTYPVLFIVAGASALWIKRYKPALVAVSASLVLLFAQALWVWPHYLAFFNLAAGGPEKGYKLLVDSSLDWGQDLVSLANWLEERGLSGQNNIPVYLSYFGAGSPHELGLDPFYLPSFCAAGLFDPRARPEPWQLTGGIYCISASQLQQVYNDTFGRWSRSYEAAYQDARKVFLRFTASLSDPSAKERLLHDLGGEEGLLKALDHYKRLRFGRLCLHLRLRQPDAWAGYSILIYEVPHKELTQALAGPPEEVYEDPGIMGKAPEGDMKWIYY